MGTTLEITYEETIALDQYGDPDHETYIYSLGGGIIQNDHIIRTLNSLDQKTGTCQYPDHEEPCMNPVGWGWTIDLVHDTDRVTWFSPWVAAGRVVCEDCAVHIDENGAEFCEALKTARKAQEGIGTSIEVLAPRQTPS
jgi:hypothetical protein